MSVLAMLFAATFIAIFFWAMGWLDGRTVARRTAPRRVDYETVAILIAMAVTYTVIGGGKTNSPPDRALGLLLSRAFSATALTDGYPYGRATWPFDTATSNAVAGMAATKVPPIPDEMADTGIAIYRAGNGEESPSPASNTVPVRAWLGIDADNRAVSTPIQFAFPFGGTAHTNIGVFSNGRLALGHATRHRRTDAGLPVAGTCRLDILAPFWGNHLLRVDDGASVGVAAGAGSLDVVWRNLSTPQSGSASNSTVSATLLADGRMVWRYAPVDPCVASNVTVGVQRGTNAWALADAGTLLSRPLSMELVPVGGVEWALADDDGDSLSNYEEFMLGTNPNFADTDGDGPSDRWELENGFPPDVPQLPDDLTDTDGDGIPDAWEARIGTNPLLADAPSAPLHDSDYDGYLDVYETRYVHTDPLNGSDPAEPDEESPLGRMDCEIDSSLPCWLVLSYDDDLEGTNDVRLAWVPGLSPTTVSMLIMASRPAKVYLEREETNGYWRASLNVYGTYLLTATKTATIEPDTYGGAPALRGDGGTPVPYVPPGHGRGGENDVEYWSFTLPSQSISVCHSETHAEILFPSLIGYGGTVTWSIMTNGPSGTGNPIAFNPSELDPGYYTIEVSVAMSGGALSKTIDLHVRTLSLTTNRIVVDSKDTSTHYLPIDMSGTHIPDGEGFTIISVPAGIDSVEFVPADLEPGTMYTVDVWNGSCGYQTLEVIAVEVEITPQAEYPKGIRSDLGVGEKLNCTIKPSGLSVTWSCTSGLAQFSSIHASSTTLSVLDVAGDLNVSVGVDMNSSLGAEALAYSTNYVVHVPEGVAYSEPYLSVPSGKFLPNYDAGAECYMEVHLAPTNVAFYNVWVEEGYSDAYEVSGIFADEDSNHPPHDGDNLNKKFNLRASPTDGYFFTDYLSTLAFHPWSAGGMEWRIPITWWISNGLSYTNTHSFGSEWKERFEINNQGATSISKFDSVVIRFINGETEFIDSRGTHK